MHGLEELKKRDLEAALYRDPQMITVEQLNVPHLGAGDVDRGIQDVVQQQRYIAGLQQPRAHLLHPCDVVDGLTQGVLGTLALGNVVEAIDRADDVSAFVGERPDVHDDRDPRTIESLDDHFRVGRLRECAGDDRRHGSLFMRYERAVRTV